jgi:hypothetical protein
MIQARNRGEESGAGSSPPKGTDRRFRVRIGRTDPGISKNIKSRSSARCNVTRLQYQKMLHQKGARK